MSRKRTTLAILAMLLVQWSADALVTLTDYAHGITLEAAVCSFVAALAGGFVARRGFLVPAIMVWTVIWAASIYVLYSIASGAGSASVLEILKYNAVTLPVSAASVLAGVLLGQKLGSRPRVAAAT
jgi:hypothetical protein